MLRIAFKLLHLARSFVDVGKQTAGGFAVEAGGGYERVVSLFALRPRQRIKLRPIIPAVFWRIRGWINPARPGLKRLAARLCFFPSGADSFVAFILRHQSSGWLFRDELVP